MRILLLVLVSISIVMLVGCEPSDERVQSGPYEGYEIYKIVDKFEEREGDKWVVQVNLRDETFMKSVSKEEFQRAEIGGVAYVHFLKVIIPRDEYK